MGGDRAGLGPMSWAFLWAMILPPNIEEWLLEYSLPPTPKLSNRSSRIWRCISECCKRHSPECKLWGAHSRAGGPHDPEFPMCLYSVLGTHEFAYCLVSEVRGCNGREKERERERNSPVRGGVEAWIQERDRGIYTNRQHYLWPPADQQALLWSLSWASSQWSNFSFAYPA